MKIISKLGKTQITVSDKTLSDIMTALIACQYNFDEISKLADNFGKRTAKDFEDTATNLMLQIVNEMK